LYSGWHGLLSRNSSINSAFNSSNDFIFLWFNFYWFITTFLVNRLVSKLSN
jgi:hypothetical protein